MKLEHFEELEVQENVEPGRAALVPEDSVCPFLGQEAWVNHAGRFDPCCAPDEQRKALGSFGECTLHIDNWLCYVCVSYIIVKHACKIVRYI